MGMKNFISNHKKLIAKLVVLSILLIVFILFLILKNNQGVCEWWTRNFAKTYLYAFGNMNKYMPFSLTELIMMILIIISLVFLISCIVYLFKVKLSRALHQVLNVLIVAMSVLSLYQVTAEMAYNREPLKLPLYEEKVEKEEFLDIIEHFINDVNECCNHLEFKEDGDLVEPYSLDELNRQLAKDYEIYEGDYLFNFTTYTKPMLSSFIYREFHITGVTFMPTAEANVNTMNVAAGKPFTSAHELAHTKGAMREEDADLVAAYITLNSSDYYVRYSGYYYTFSSLLSLANYSGVEDAYTTMTSKLHTKFIKNLRFNRAYWDKHNSWQKFASWWNDIYLKISGEKEGTDSYGDNTPTVDPGTREITSFSNYQKLYFSLYYK